MTTQSIHPETGQNCHVEIGADVVTKTSIRFFSGKAGNERLRLLQCYAADLDQQPVPVAPLISTALAEANPGQYAVRFTMGLISGPSVERLPTIEHREAAAKIIGYLCAMPRLRRLGEPDILRSPVDALFRNWHMDGDTPTLVDIYPPLLRDRWGRIIHCRAFDKGVRRDAEQRTGRLGTMVPSLIGRALGGMGQKESLDWAMATLPQSGRLRTFLGPRVKSRVQRHFRLFFSNVLPA